MKRIRYWFTRRKLLMAQAVDLQRQLQEAWDKCDTLITERALMAQDVAHLRNQLNRVARERYQERELRLEAEKLSKHPLYKETNDEN